MIRSILFLLTAVVFFTEWSSAQTSGVITYEVTRQVQGRKIQVIRSQDGGGSWTSSTIDENSAPMVVNLKQEILFTPGLGKIKSPVPEGRKTPPGAEVRMVRPFEEETFIDFNNERLLKYLKAGMGQDSTVYFTEEGFQTASGWEDTKRTKDILGYTCRKARGEREGRKYTIWYTEELNLTFSPVNGLLPEKGFVLAIEGDDLVYKAINIDFREIDLREVSPPAPTQQVDAEGYEAARKRMVEEIGKAGGVRVFGRQ